MLLQIDHRKMHFELARFDIYIVFFKAHLNIMRYMEQLLNLLFVASGKILFYRP